jgi:hypothetical protein
LTGVIIIYCLSIFKYLAYIFYDNRFVDTLVSFKYFIFLTIF